MQKLPASRQKAEDGVSLIPLRSGYTTWEIDTYEEDLAGVLLVTDGVLDALSPYLLKISAPHTSSSPGLYMPMGSWLADPAGIPEEDEGRIVLKERMEIYVTGDMEYDSDFFYERMAAIYRERIPEHAEEVSDDESCEVNTHEYDEHNETPDILQ